MTRKHILAIDAVLVVLSAAWVYYSLDLSLKTNMTMRRELAAFEERLKTDLRFAPPEVRKHLVETGHITDNNNGVVILGVGGETFEEMRVRITEPLRLPMWPGLVALASGFVILIFAIPARDDPKNS